MEFSSGLALKVLGGLGVLSVGSTGIYFVNDYFQNSLTRFDKALINYLNTTGQDIIFTITGVNGTFPTFSEDNSVTVTAQVSLNTSSANSFKGGDQKNAKIKELKKLSKADTGDEGKDWTWTCVLKFSKNGTGTELEDGVKKHLAQTTNTKGFFNQLKEDTTTGSLNNEQKASVKKIKENFIKNCALGRTRAKNKEINGKETLAEDNLSVAKTFQLDTSSSGTNSGKLYFKNSNEFNTWFPGFKAS